MNQRGVGCNLSNSWWAFEPRWRASQRPAKAQPSLAQKQPPPPQQQQLEEEGLAAQQPRLETSAAGTAAPFRSLEGASAHNHKAIALSDCHS